MNDGETYRGSDRKAVGLRSGRIFSQGLRWGVVARHAEKAGYTKGAIYIRYPDKESLYRALVEPAANGFCELLEKSLSGFSALSAGEQTVQMFDYANDGFPAIIDYLYDHFDAFKLLFTSGETCVYQEFIHRVVELDTTCTTNYITVSHNDALTSGRLTPGLNHLLSSAFYTGMFEVIVHDMPKSEAVEHIRRMRRFYSAGWQTIFQRTEVRLCEWMGGRQRMDSLSDVWK